MPTNSKHLLIKSLLLGLVWQTHCFPTLPHGKIICVSDQSGRTDAKIKDAVHLTTAEVKAKVIETYSESDVRNVLEEIPWFYNYKSTIFTNLNQRNAIRNDYILIGNQLQSIKDQLRSPPESMSETDLDEVSHTIEKLEAFQKLIQKEIQDRIYKMKDQGSHIKEIQINGIEENGSLKNNANIASPSSGTAFPSDLGIDLVEEIILRVWDGQIDKLSGILHRIPLPRGNYQEINYIKNEMSLDLQNLIFQQVGYMNKQKIISGEAFKKFCQSKKTLEIAALNMIYTTAYPKFFANLSPVTVLNEWTSETYRKIYEVLDEENKRYFLYISLKAYDYLSNWNEHVQPEELFTKDEFFHILENLFFPPSRLSYSSMNSQDLRNQGPNYQRIKEFVQSLIQIFEDNGDSLIIERNRKRSFFFLDFIKTHYGLGMLELEKGEKFEEKMSLMSSSFQLWGELNNILWYLQEVKIPRRNIPETKKDKNGEQILMIYKLSKDLVLKHKNLFLDSEMSNYCSTSSLKLQVKYIDELITDIMDQHNYYLIHDQSSILISEESEMNHFNGNPNVFNQLKTFFSKINCFSFFKRQR